MLEIKTKTKSSLHTTVLAHHCHAVDYNYTSFILIISLKRTEKEDLDHLSELSYSVELIT